MTLTGLDVSIRGGFAALRGQRIGVVCNQASVAQDCRHILDNLREASMNVVAVFGPQHGLWGHTQDNMIEWEGQLDPRTGVVVHSLYGEHRKPTPEMFAGLDRLVIDLQDIGARYYTFIWTMALCLQACADVGLPVTILDRPNPINGISVEGPVLDPAFASFVGLHPLPIRHGMTIGEIARWLSQNHIPGVELDVVQMEGWSRDMDFDQTGLPWIPPSPNMPTVDTAFVYPGGCLLEGTNLSEGRGTTRPFEQFGTPFIDGVQLCRELNGMDLPGCLFRYVEFQPTSGKWMGEICQGVFVHVLDRKTLRPFETYLAALWQVRKQCGSNLEWKKPPYEYEFQKRPIDIIVGNGTLIDQLDAGLPFEEIVGATALRPAAFHSTRTAAQIYPD